MVAVTPELIYELMLEIQREQRAAEQQRAADQKATHAEMEAIRDQLATLNNTVRNPVSLFGATFPNSKTA